MKSWLKKHKLQLNYTFSSSQWLSNRILRKSSKIFSNVTRATILEIESGNSQFQFLIHPSNILVRLDSLTTNKRYLNTPDIYRDTDKLPVNDSSRDAALLLEVTEHVSDDLDTIKVVFRKIKPTDIFNFLIRFIYLMHDQRHGYRRYTNYGIIRLLKVNGIILESINNHKNTAVTTLQLVNLNILELCNKTHEKNIILSIILSAVFSPACLLINFLAWPCIPQNMLNISRLGYFIVASGRHGK